MWLTVRRIIVATLAWSPWKLNSQGAEPCRSMRFFGSGLPGQRQQSLAQKRCIQQGVAVFRDQIEVHDLLTDEELIDLLELLETHEDELEEVRRSLRDSAHSLPTIWNTLTKPA